MLKSELAGHGLNLRSAAAQGVLLVRLLCPWNRISVIAIHAIYLKTD